MADESNTLLRPRPQRPFNLTPTSTESSAPQTPPSRENSDSSRLELDSNGEKSTSRTRSVLNLTSSTLFGIYSPSDYDSNRTEPATPGGNGSQTPVLRASMDDKRPPLIGLYERPQLRRTHLQQHHFSFRDYLVVYGLRTVLLFCIGVAYGVIISHLHDTEHVTPVRIEGIERWSWGYLMGWGGVGVLLGGLLPWVDIFWEEVLGDDKTVFSSNPRPEESRTASGSGDEEQRPASRLGSGLGADWNPVVRSIGAFIGIAFAIRRLPWQSTLQVSLTLALVNPFLWYLVDRSKPGFLLSLLVGIAGTAIAFGVNPEIVPSPAAPSPRVGVVNVPYYGEMHEGLISNESIGVGTWIASVLFCSSVCFGNVGRMLALGTRSTRPSIS